MLNFHFTHNPLIAEFCNAQALVFKRNRLIVGIMNGPNPLSVEDVERLAQQHPERWRVYVGYVRAFHEAKAAKSAGDQ